MKATELPSGSWRVQIRLNGKRVSVTAESEDEAIYKATLLKTGRKKINNKSRSVGECIDDYIESKRNILSPSTIDGYEKTKKNYLTELCNININDIDNLTIQKHINKLSLSLSAKTVSNAHGLLISVLNVYAPDLKIKTTLPKVQKKIKQLPDAREVVKAIQGTEVELPCLFAVWCSLRMSEVRGIKKTAIQNGVLTIKNTIITVKGKNIEKTNTKTIESTRIIRIPPYIQTLIDSLPEDQEYLTKLSGQAIYKRFVRILQAKGIKHMSFHELRHMDASIMLALGVPDKYAMERGGWSTPNIMKSVYQHTFSKEREAFDDKIDAFFNNILEK